MSNKQGAATASPSAQSPALGGQESTAAHGSTTAVVSVNTAAQSARGHTGVPDSAKAANADSGSAADWATAVLAFLALIVSILAYRVAKSAKDEQTATASKLQKASAFNEQFGHPIRDALRNLEKALTTLEALLTPGYSSLTLRELKTEIETYRTAWENAASDVILLLGETEMSEVFTKRPWTKTFSDHFTSAVAHLDSIGNNARVSSKPLFSAAASAALKSFKDAISATRGLLDAQANENLVQNGI